MLVNCLVQVTELQEKLRQVNVIKAYVLFKTAADLLPYDQRGKVNVGVFHDVLLHVAAVRLLPFPIHY